MLDHKNKNIVLAYVDAFNQADLEGLCRLFSPDALIYGVMGWGEINRVKTVWKSLMESFAIHLRVESMVAEGDMVAVRFTEKGQFTRSFEGAAATGKNYEVVAMEWFVIRNDLILRRWGVRDAAEILRQTGLPPRR